MFLVFGTVEIRGIDARCLLHECFYEHDIFSRGRNPLLFISISPHSSEQLNYLEHIP